MRWLVLSALFVAILFNGQATASITFDNTSEWTSNSTGNFGPTAVFGQTILAPTPGPPFTNYKLDDFTFYLSANPGQTFNLVGEVRAWVGSLTGPGHAGAALTISSVIPYTGTGSYQAVTINPGLPLNPGSQYVLLLWASTGSTGTGAMKTIDASSGSYTLHNPSIGSGQFFYSGTPDNASNWGTFGTDLVFTAHFSEFPAAAGTPEPASLAIWGGIGLATILTARRRKRI